MLKNEHDLLCYLDSIGRLNKPSPALCAMDHWALALTASLHGCHLKYVVSPSMPFITSVWVKLGHCLPFFFFCLLHATLPVPQYVETISSKQNELDNYIAESYKNALSEERRRYCFLVDRQCAVAKSSTTYHNKVRIHIMLKKIWVAETLKFNLSKKNCTMHAF